MQRDYNNERVVILSGAPFCAAKDLNHSIVPDQISEELHQQSFRTRQPATVQ
jgi:hypothetical protein